MRTYCVRHANYDDIDALVALRVHAETWLSEAGIEQWTVRQTGINAVTEGVQEGKTYAVDFDDEPIGSFTLNGADLDFWTPTEALEPAAYLYKFMIRSDHRGTGLGDQLLDWACERSAAAGFTLLRLDCWRTNTGLHAYYLNRGFEQVGMRTAGGRKSGALFQRPTDLMLAKPRVRLLDETERRVMTKRYDPTGRAEVFEEAAQLIVDMKLDAASRAEHDWNAALDQAARRLERESSEIRQASGMYYRVLDGRGDDTPIEMDTSKHINRQAS